MEPVHKNAVLDALNATVAEGVVSSKAWADAHGFVHDDVVGVAKSETAHERLKMSAPVTEDMFEATEEGKLVLVEGSPEARLYRAIPEGGIKRDELVASFGPALAPGN
jgi:hypothetical protein